MNTFSEMCGVTALDKNIFEFLQKDRFLKLKDPYLEKSIESQRSTENILVQKCSLEVPEVMIRY